MKKKIWVSIIAGAAAIAAAAVAIAAFIKRKSEALSDHLDYDPEEYFEADEENLGGEEEEPAQCGFECENEEGDADCENCPFAEDENEDAEADEAEAEKDEDVQ